MRGCLRNILNRSVSQTKRLGILLEELEKANLLDRYFILVQSDHGGHGKEPWNRSARRSDNSVDCSLDPRSSRTRRDQGDQCVFLTLHTTLAHVLDLPMSEDWEGQPIMEIF